MKVGEGGRGDISRLGERACVLRERTRGITEEQTKGRRDRWRPATGAQDEEMKEEIRAERWC